MKLTLTLPWQVGPFVAFDEPYRQDAGYGCYFGGASVSTQNFCKEEIQPPVLTRLAEHAERAGTINDLLKDMLGEREGLTRRQEELKKTRQVTADEWSRTLRAWAAGHQVRAVIADDSREGIYEGRGE